MEIIEEKTTAEKDLISSKETIGKSQGLLVILTGPTGAGKDKVMEEILRRYPKMQRIVSVTTRDRRVEDGEVHGKDYFFLYPDKTPKDRETEFLRMKERGEFLETNKYEDAYYGTLREDIEPVLSGREVIWRVDPSRAATVEELFMTEFPRLDVAEELIKRTLVVYIGVPRLTILKDRFLGRKRETGEEERSYLGKKFKKRLKGDWGIWHQYKDKFKNVVINETGALDKTVEEISRLIEEHRHTTS